MSDVPTRTEGEVGAARPARRRRRWVRVVLWSAGALVLLAGVGTWMVTSGPVPGWVAVSAVRSALGAELKAGAVRLRWDGVVEVENLVLTAPASTGLTGAEAVLLEAPRAEVRLDWSGVWSGKVRPVLVRVEGPRLRLSQDRVTAELNVAQLRPAPSATPTMSQVPEVELVGATIELGEHAGGGPYAALVELVADAEVRRGGAPGKVTVNLVERATAGLVGAPLTVTGELDVRAGGGEVRVSAVDLSRWTAERVPTQFREVWRGLDIDGRIDGVVLSFSRGGAGGGGGGGAGSTAAGGIRAELRMSGVGVNLPIPAGQLEVVGSRTARMEGVKGTIRLSPAGIDANLDGLFTGVSCNLDLVMTGLTPQSPYRAQVLARPFRLSENPRLLWFLQPVVRRTLDENFGSPDAVLEAAFYVRRGEPTSGADGVVQAAVPEISGELAFRDGSARYALLPYPVQELSGQVRFDSKSVTLLGVRGRTPSGAGLFIEGTYAPPTDEGGLAIKLTMTDAPIDEALLDAMALAPGGNRMDLLLSRRDYKALRTAGLVQTAAERREAVGAVAALEAQPVGERAGDYAARLEAAKAQAARHVFELGGYVERADFSLRREAGADQPIRTLMEVRIDRANLLSKEFPYPLQGSGVRVVVDDDAATVRADTLTGPSGTPVSLFAFLPRRNGNEGRLPAEGGMDIRIDATGVPVDPFVLFAVREGVDGPLPPAGAARELADIPVHELLTTLAMEGAVNTTVRVEERPMRRVGYEVVLTLPATAPLSASAGRDGGKGVVLGDISGRVVVNERGINIESLRGTVAPEDPTWALSPAPWFLNGNFARAQLAEGRPTVGTVTLDVANADVSMRVEPLLSKLAPELAEAVAAQRAELDPRGTTDLRAQITAYSRPAPERVVTTLELSNIRGLTVSALGGRLEAGDISGTINLAVDSARSALGEEGPADLRLDGVSFRPTYEGAPIGAVTLNGALRVGSRGPMGVTVRDPMVATVRGAELHSPLMRKAVATYASEDAGAWLVDSDVRGRFDAEVRLTPVVAEAGERAWGLSGELRPEWLSIRRGGVVVTASNVSGQATFTETGGAIENVSLITEGFDALVSGKWKFDAAVPGAFEVTASATASGGRIDSTIRALLPSDAVGAIDGTGLQMAAGFDVRSASVKLRSAPAAAGRAAAGREITLDARANLAFSDLQADIGVPLRDARGEFSLAVTREPGGGPTLVGIDARTAVMRVSGVTLSDAVVQLRSDGDGLSVPVLTGACSSGRLSASARTFDVPGGERWYRARIQLAGVRFADLLKELSRAAAASGGGAAAMADGAQGAVASPGPRDAESDAAPERTQPATEAILPLGLAGGAGDLTRGALDAEFSVEGPVGDVERRRGRGAIRISGGDVLRIPLAVPMINLFNLQLPFDERLDYFHAVTYLHGRTLRFEELGLLSRSLSIMGWGTVTLPSLTLDLRFASRGQSRIPFLSGLWEALRNEIAVVRVTGRVDGPSVGTESLGGTRAMLSGMMPGGGGGASGGAEAGGSGAGREGATAAMYGFTDEAEARARAARARAIAGERLSLPPPPGAGALRPPLVGGGAGGLRGGVPSDREAAAGVPSEQVVPPVTMPPVGAAPAS